MRVTTQYDADQWQVMRSKLPDALVTWDDQGRIDAGVPEDVVARFWTALSASGSILFANRTAAAPKTVPIWLWRPWVWPKRSRLTQADDEQTFRTAFEAAGHDWTIGAQWLISGPACRTADPNTVAFARELFSRSTVPDSLPPGVTYLVRAATDGDAAQIVAKNSKALADLTDALISRQ